MTWAGEALAAIRKIILIEERIGALAEQIKSLADRSVEFDRRLVRIEAKFEIIEHLAAARGKGAALPRRRKASKSLPK